MTMEQKHTPGPWTMSRYHYPHRDIVQRTGQDDNDAFPGSRLICRTFSDNPNYKANACLIASAPTLLAERDKLREINKELLAALKLMYKAWEALIPCLGNSVVQDYGLVLTTAPCAATKAIAEAEKEEK